MSESGAGQASSDVVCIAFPTIMSGLVLRWYADETQQVEIANAGRESAWTDLCSDDVRSQAEEAHAVIAHAYTAELHPKIDVSGWVTHRRVGGLLSDEIKPVSADA